jgi:hypothetical protein
MTRRWNSREQEAIDALEWLQGALGASVTAAEDLLAGDREPVAYESRPVALSEHHRFTASATTGNPAALETYPEGNGQSHGRARPPSPPPVPPQRPNTPEPAGAPAPPPVPVYSWVLAQPPSPAPPLPAPPPPAPPPPPVPGPPRQGQPRQHRRFHSI